MTTAIDVALLDRKNGPEVVLVGNQRAENDGHGGAFSGFDAFARVELEIRLGSLNGPDAELTIALEHSDDGDSWTTADDHAFTAIGVYHAEIENPKSYLRISWAKTAGTLQRALIKSAKVIPGSLDRAAESGGSQPGAQRWIGPHTVFANLLQTLYLSASLEAVGAVNQGTKTFTISNSNRPGATVIPGSTFSITGSTGNDGTYTVASATPTEVTTVEAIPDATADGTFNVAAADGGTFTLLYDGDETAPIAWDASAATVKAALAALPGLAAAMTLSVYEHNNFPTPGDLPGDLDITIVNLAARPLPLTIGDNSLTAGSDVASPQVCFNAQTDAWYCISDVAEGDLVVDTFVGRIEDFLGTTAIGFYDAAGNFLFPGNQYIPVGDAAASANLPGFTHNESTPQTAQMTDAATYGEIPTLVLADGDLFVRVLNRDNAADDSAGEYRLYLALATPAPIGA